MQPNEQGVIEEPTMQAYTEALNYDGIAINRMFLVINRKALEGLGDCAKGAMHVLTCGPFENEVAILQGITVARKRKRSHANEAKDSKDDKDVVKYNVVKVVKLKRVLKHIFCLSRHVGWETYAMLGCGFEQTSTL